MPLTVLDHALGKQLVTQLRDSTTPPSRYRPLTATLTKILLLEATRNLPLREEDVQTPLETTTGYTLVNETVAVPVLRAGLGMLDGFLDILPESTVGYVGMERDEATAIATSYYCKLPPLKNRSVFLLDPMLATGGSVAWAANRLNSEGAASVYMLSIVAAPQGVARLQESFPNLHVVTAVLDRELNDKKYILPGLGDFGDRLYGTL